MSDVSDVSGSVAVSDVSDVSGSVVVSDVAGSVTGSGSGASIISY